MMTTALIPARGGSKRIPNKNIREFDGVPILGRVIRKVADAGVFDRIIVSTDSDLVATVASTYGADVLRRQGELAGDHVGLLEVVKAQSSVIQSSIHEDVLACVLPTAVLMSAEHLAEAVRVVLTKEDCFVLSIGRFRYPIQRALRFDGDDRVSMFAPENYSTRSQDLEPAFHDAGQFYVGTVGAWQSRETIFDSPARGLVVDDWRVQDIDDERDWEHAENLWRLIEHSA